MSASRDEPDTGSHAAQLHNSRLVRGLLLVAGVLSLTIGIIGLFLPLLPTAPLVILAAACFARAYRPFHEWLLDHRWFGPMLREWYQHRSVPYRAKVLGLIAMLIGFGGSILLFVRPAWAQLLCALFALALAAVLYRIPSRDGPRS